MSINFFSDSLHYNNFILIFIDITSTLYFSSNTHRRTAHHGGDDHKDMSTPGRNQFIGQSSLQTPGKSNIEKSTLNRSHVRPDEGRTRKLKEILSQPLIDLGLLYVNF